MFNARVSNIVRLWTTVTLLFVVGATRLVYASESLKVCVPDQSVPPFYFVQDNRVSGLTLNHLNALFEQPNLSDIGIEYIPEPWQRCLKDIESGGVDMLVAGYSQERAMKAVYPDSMGFDLDESVFSYAQICLVKKASDQWSWDGEKLVDKDQVILGLEPGFLIPEERMTETVERVVSVWDVSQKYELVKLDRVDAVLTVCGVMDEVNIPDRAIIPSDLDVVFPPYIDSPVYLVFSAAFYRQFPDTAKTIVDASHLLNMSIK